MSQNDEQKINYDDIPELDDSFWMSAKFVAPAKKRPITIRLDDDIITYFKTTSPKYQTQMNRVLRSYVDAQKAVA